MVSSGYTVLRCLASGCGSADDATVSAQLDRALREVVRRSRHGVLVGTGCLVGGCGWRPVAPVVVVQPCDADRRPTAGALRLGPLRTPADVEALTAWLSRGAGFDPALLPTHLLDLHRRVGAAPQN